MPRRPSAFRQTDVSRALRAAQAAGLKPTRAEITPEGGIVLSFDGSAAPQPNEAFDAWKAKRHARPT